MKQEYVNAFLAPAMMVWEKELGSTLTLEKAEGVSNQFTTEDLTAVIGVSGNLEGSVLYGFTGGSAQTVASKMIGETIEELDGMALSALGEIANMITGNAATQLSGLGYVCDISPPVIIEPAGSRFTTTGKTAILVTFTSDLGNIRIRISLYESTRR